MLQGICYEKSVAACVVSLVKSLGVSYGTWYYRVIMCFQVQHSLFVKMLQRCAYFAELVSFLLASPEWNIVSFLLPKASPRVGD